MSRSYIWNNDDEGARMTRLEEIRATMKTDSPPAPRERQGISNNCPECKDPHDCMMRDRCALSETTPIQAHSKTEYKRLREQGANVLPPASPAATPRTDLEWACHPSPTEAEAWELSMLVLARSLERELAEARTAILELVKTTQSVESKFAAARAVLYRYRHEIPIGNQPYMIADMADSVLEAK